MKPIYHTELTGTLTASGVLGAAFAALSRAPKKDLLLFLRVTAASGTSPSCTIKLQGSADESHWADIPSGAFAAQTAVTAAGTAIRLALSDILDPFLQVYATISGTTPSFTLVVDVFESSDS